MEEKQFLTVPNRYQMTRQHSRHSPTLAELDDDDVPGLGYTHTLVRSFLIMNFVRYNKLPFPHISSSHNITSHYQRIIAVGSELYTIIYLACLVIWSYNIEAILYCCVNRNADCC